jgi:predicted transposase/invertase (TIGR01784 family)
MGAAEALLSLANAVRADKGIAPLAEIVELNSQYSIIGERKSDKIGRLDVLAKAGDGSFTNFEMQVSEFPHMDERLAFYAANILAPFKSGDDYEELPAVNIVLIEGGGHKVSSDGKYHHTFSMRDDEPPHGRLSGWPVVHKLSLPTFERVGRYDKNDMLSVWLRILTDGYKDREFMREVSEMDAGIQQFAQRYNLALNDPDLRRKIDYHRSAEMDYTTRINAARRSGAQEMRRRFMKAAVNYLLSGHDVPALEAMFPEFSSSEIKEICVEADKAKARQRAEADAQDHGGEER